MKLAFRYNSMLNFIQVSFCFILFLGLRLRLGSVIGRDAPDSNLYYPAGTG